MNKTQKVFKEHVDEAIKIHGDNVIFVALQGSQNYDLAYEESDVDTKAILVPSFYDIAFNKKAISYTHVRENEEHIDFKDLRLIFQTFRKQNINFMEILFSKYSWINPEYKEELDELIAAKEQIARYNSYRALKCMKGMILEKKHALCHPYPSKLEILDRLGYDPKQLSHIVRIHDFSKRFIEGESYEKCLIPKDKEFILNIKKGVLTYEAAMTVADSFEADAVKRIDEACEYFKDEPNEEVEEILNNIQYRIMKKAVRKEFKE